MVSVTANGNWHLFVLWLFGLSVLLYQNIYTYIRQIRIWATGTFLIEPLILAQICLFQIPQAAFIK